MVFEDYRGNRALENIGISPEQLQTFPNVVRECQKSFGTVQNTPMDADRQNPSHLYIRQCRPADTTADFKSHFRTPWADVHLAKKNNTFWYIELGVGRSTLNHVLPVGRASVGCKRAAGRLLTPSGRRASSV